MSPTAPALLYRTLRERGYKAVRPLVGVSAISLLNWATGRARPSPENAARVEAALGIPADGWGPPRPSGRPKRG